MALFLCCLCFGSAATAQPLSPATLIRQLGAQGVAQTDLGALFEGIPLASALRGRATVSVLTGMEQQQQKTRLVGTALVWQQFHLSSPEARIGPLPIGELDLHLVMYKGQSTTVTLKLSGPWITLTGTLALSGAVSIDLQKGAYAWEDGEVVGQLSVAGKGVSGGVVSPRFEPWQWGDFELNATLSGRLSQPECHATLLAHGIRAWGVPLGALRVQWDHRRDQTTLIKGLFYGRKGVAGARETFDISGEATLPLDLDLLGGTVAWRREELHEITLGLASGTGALDIGRFIQGVDVLRAKSANFSLSGALGHPQVRGEFRGDFGRGGLKINLDLDSAKSPLGELWTVVLEQRKSEALKGVFETEIDWGKVVGDRVIAPDTPVSGQLSGDLPLAALSPWAVGLSRLGGVFRYAVSVSGSLGAPQLVGEGGLAGGVASVVALNRQVEEMAVVANFEGSRVRYTFEGVSRPGRLQAQGVTTFGPGGQDADTAGAQVSFWEQWHFRHEVDVALKRAPFVHDSFPISLIDATLRATIHTTPQRTVAQVTVFDALVETTKESLPVVNPIPANDDVVFIDKRPAPGAAGLAKVLKGEGELRLDLVLERPVLIRGPSATIRLVGAMAMVREGQRVEVEGGLRPEPGGRLELYENEFEVISGRLSLEAGHLGKPVADEPGRPVARPLEPVLAMAAKGEVNGTQVLVRLEGPLEQPSLLLSSEPPLPEYQIMTLLVTGRADVLDERNGDVRRSVARLVERYHNPSLEQQLIDRIGVDRLNLGFGASVRNPVVTVGKQVTKRLYVETVYRHGAPEGVNMMEGRIEHQLDPKWTVDTVFGDAAEGRLGLYWTTRFGRQVPVFDTERWNTLGAVASTGDEDGDGVPDAFDLCATRPEDLDGYEDEDGCAEVDNDGDGILDAEDKAPLEPETFNGYEDEDGAPDKAPAGGVGFRFEPLVWEVLPAGWLGEDELRVKALAWAFRQWGGKQVTVRAYGVGQSDSARRLVRRRSRQVVRALGRQAGAPASVRTQEVLEGEARVEVVWE